MPFEIDAKYGVFLAEIRGRTCVKKAIHPCITSQYRILLRLEDECVCEAIVVSKSRS